MNRMQLQVLEFHRKFGSLIGVSPGLRGCELGEDGIDTKSIARLRQSLVLEEAKEFSEAVNNKDFISAIDALCDILYVVFGTAVSFGIDLEPFFDEVHRTNMLKEGGGIREDGKILKPEGWKPPKIREILEVEISKSTKE